MTDAEVIALGERLGWNVTAMMREAGKTTSGSFERRARSLKPATPLPVAPVSRRGPQEDEAPAWQGYRPRPGWSEPAKAKAAASNGGKTIVSIDLADVHGLYRSKRDFECALGIIRDVKPDEVNIDGDFLEMEALSRHPKSRPDLARLAEEYYDGNVLLDSLQSAHQGRKTRYLQGNHEGRAERYEAEYGQLDGMLSVPQALYIEPRSDYRRETTDLRGIEWVPLKMQPFTVRNVARLHGVFESQYHAWMTAQHLGPRHLARHIISAHMHGWQSATSASGFTAYACPWLGDETAHVFRAYVKGKPRPWNVGILHVEEAGELVTVTPIFIRNGRALFGGHVVEARAA